MAISDLAIIPIIVFVGSSTGDDHAYSQGLSDRTKVKG
jgi:hypothetical protein